MSKGKIYDDDPKVYARTTKIKPLRTKSDIDGVLARFKIKDSWWHWDIENDKVELRFMLSDEKFGNNASDIPIILNPPMIWHRARNKDDKINWNASMRNMYYYIWTHLSQAYVSQSGNVAEFLQHVLTKNGHTFIENLYKTPQLIALPETIRRVN